MLFYENWQHDPLVIDKWFALQASAPDRGGNILPLVRQLMAHPDFNLRNPNRARSVISNFCQGNPGAFWLLKDSRKSFSQLLERLTGGGEILGTAVPASHRRFAQALIDRGGADIVVPGQSANLDACTWHG